jgi:hypothetical protein
MKKLLLSLFLAVAGAGIFAEGSGTSFNYAPPAATVHPKGKIQQIIAEGLLVRATMVATLSVISLLSVIPRKP